MNITNTLIRLRDDLKEWVTNNIIILNERFATKSELNNLENRIEELENIIENGGYVPPSESDSLIGKNLIDGEWFYLNKKFNRHDSTLIEQYGTFSIIVPFEGDGETHILKFRNLIANFGRDGSTLFFLDENKVNAGYPNGSYQMGYMTSGVTKFDDNKSADVEFVVPTTTKYFAITVNLKATTIELTQDDVANTIVSIDKLPSEL